MSARSEQDGAARYRWELVSAQSEKQSGDDGRPAVRYGHSAVLYGDEMVATHGYYHDHSDGAHFLDDTWSFSCVEPWQWRQLCVDAGEKPSKRFHHTAVVLGSDLYIFGGSDGGAHRHGCGDFRFGFEFADLWRLSLEMPQTWQAVHACATDDGQLPGARHMHAACAAAGSMWMHGGLVGDSSGRVDLLRALGARYGHKMVQTGPAAFVLAGGRKRNEECDILDDVWHCVLEGDGGCLQPVWTKLPSLPQPRCFHAMAALGEDIVIFGGNSHPVFNRPQRDACLLQAGDSAWKPILAKRPNDDDGGPPHGTVHSTLLAVPRVDADAGGTWELLLFAGESTSPHEYINAVYRLKFPGQG
eukprot:TRINITY_DN26424_c0_g1_i4.p1 TRINITY_DN26424_c0_g1~~TRINITY_DN26424_c0_g1_i4.p1  ORF type:complete len:358 (+),score=44.71 TRINITY_DN26424_c0_g1_i4:168-1241(+)